MITFTRAISTFLMFEISISNRKFSVENAIPCNSYLPCLSKRAFHWLNLPSKCFTLLVYAFVVLWMYLHWFIYFFMENNVVPKCNAMQKNQYFNRMWQRVLHHLQRQTFCFNWKKSKSPHPF